ncbi:hypothetical protein NDU88_000018 [Pleurodeles waltl]|uniref:Uncharacterized protein n=1 Tax=Pleurodeles waltl TaxID=8319 RepID=A0AAV7UPW3_PLEWA|nr:hypothetical protein NDU88_000018 [Pleurodeles waltl]
MTVGVRTWGGQRCLQGVETWTRTLTAHSHWLLLTSAKKHVLLGLTVRYLTKVSSNEMMNPPAVQLEKMNDVRSRETLSCFGA